MHAEELVGRLQTCPDEELAAVLEPLTQLVDRARRRAARVHLVSLARAAAEELRDEPPMDAAGIRAYLGRDREPA